jgi:prepilin-type N-terminal cleavage/methylation domain-containing protein
VHVVVTMANVRRPAAGFSLIEVLLVVSLGAVLTGMTLFAFQVAQRQIQGDANLRLLTGQLETAREQAVTQRRSVEIRFVGTNEIATFRREVPAGVTPLARVFFEGNARYTMWSGVPDTPDGFGNAAAVDFGTAAVTMFGPDGMFVDAAGVPVNGTVFLGTPDRTETARAVTVFGATGRVRGYRWNGSQWVR